VRYYDLNKRPPAILLHLQNCIVVRPAIALLQAERVAKLSDVAKHEKELHDIQSQLDQYAENDPDKINSMST